MRKGMGGLVLVVVAISGCNDAPRRDTVSGVPSPEAGTIHNEILAEFHSRQDLTSGVRLGWDTWADLLLESADVVYEQHGMAVRRAESKATLVSLEKVLHALKEETGLDIRDLRGGATSNEDFVTLIGALRKHDWVGEKAANTAIELALSPDDPLWTAPPRDIDPEVSDLLGVATASRRFWTELDPVLGVSESQPLDGGNNHCAECTTRADMIGGIVARKVCHGMSWCADLGAAAASLAYVVYEEFCSNHDCDFSFPPLCPSCR